MVLYQSVGHSTARFIDTLSALGVIKRNTRISSQGAVSHLLNFASPKRRRSRALTWQEQIIKITNSELKL